MDLILSGGWIMVAIIAASGLGFALVIERLMVYSRATVPMRQLVSEVEKHIRTGNYQEALDSASRFSGVVPDVYAMAIEHELHAAGDPSCDQLDEAVSIYVRTVTMPQLRRFLRPIGLIGSSAPMLGLLGTVFGMINLFSTMASQGMGDPTAFTKGVGQALTTTAAGLLVAIPLLYCHGLLQSKLEQIENDINHYVPRLLRWLRTRSLTAREAA